MSLFKIRELWTTHCESEDEVFDQNSMIVTKLDNTEFLVTGSHSGVLRIFKPFNGSDESGFSAADLLAEKKYEQPILQVGSGQLVSGSHQLQLAVLQPRLLSVCNVNVKQGISEQGTESNVEELYEHKLHQPAVSFVIGPFGGVQNRDFICVLCIDGTLCFFEQESEGFMCMLPDCLLPGPFVYVKEGDLFVTSGGKWMLESYRFKHLSEAEGKKRKANLTPSWCYNLGEYVLDMQTVDDRGNKETWINVLGERNLFCLNSKGKLKFMKRLEYTPVLLYAFICNDQIVSLVMSDTNTLFVYHNTTLKWSAKLHFSPICLRRARIRNLEGVLVFISEEGRLEACYLGTEPSLFVAPPLTLEEEDFAKLEDELRKAQQMMKNSYGDCLKISNANVDKELGVDIKVASELKPCSFQTLLNITDDLQMCEVTADVSPQIPFEEVQITTVVHTPFTVDNPVTFLTNINEKSTTQCKIYLNADYEVPSLGFTTVVTTVSSVGIPRAFVKSHVLPVKLVCKLDEAQKEAEHKLTLSVNQDVVPLSALFQDLINSEKPPNTLGIKPLTPKSKTVTIVPAKSTQRYRLQADSFASISFVLEQMIYRLQAYYKNKDLEISYGVSYPINELFSHVQEHFEMQKEVSTLKEKLNQFNTQFRLFEKRFVEKLKMKNLSSLSNVEILLTNTHYEILNTIEMLENKEKKLIEAQVRLLCCFCIFKQLISTADIDEKLKEMLFSLFSGTLEFLQHQKTNKGRLRRCHRWGARYRKSTQDYCQQGIGRRNSLSQVYERFM
ncbi:unnamed protein product [Acanthoscelides obtectus]|uniref:Protein PTHB1 n=1 Tax=Acanthoscelides obtectus TaxID=200917 RepID=A0A9P0LRZ5_ACAOB|nr:unnamed protein product [Acanthoscelides obtectus]CAK1621638.1 Protein PTHB1 [Acanthoscelides obtectus]